MLMPDHKSLFPSRSISKGDSISESDKVAGFGVGDEPELVSDTLIAILPWTQDEQSQSQFL